MLIVVLFASNLPLLQTSTQALTLLPPPEYARNFRLPGNMRGVVLRPEFSEENELPTIPGARFAEIAALGMNTAIIETTVTKDGRQVLIYDTDINRRAENESDPLSAALDAAQSCGLSVFLVLDLSAFSRDLNTLIAQVHKFVRLYRADGIILDGFGNTRCEESFTRYMAQGSGIGYENWLYEEAQLLFTAAANTIKITDNAVPVGIMLRDVWANFTRDSRGSGTSAAHESYFDSFADTLSFIESGHVDFAVAHTPDALTNASVPVPFEAIAAYWNRACTESDIALYIMHHNQRMGENSAGWLGEDQLLRQISYARTLSAYGGSVFNSPEALRANRLKSTDTLRAFFAAEIDEETLFEDMRLELPRSLSFTTQDAMAIFQGTHDNNFPVYINDTEIVLNEAGSFYIEMPLEIGTNRFALLHKGQAAQYTIERRIIALHSIDASLEARTGTKLEVEGGTEIAVTAVAYRGANVSANINGRTVTLTQQNVPLDDPVLNVSYALFSGTFTAPEGIISREQDLGQIRVSASYRGFTNSILGTNIRVIALPEPPPPPPEPPPPSEVTWYAPDADSAGSQEVVGRIPPVRTSSESARIVRILRDNTHVFAANTTGITRDPTLSYLPAGTREYFRSQVGEFYTTTSGRRVRAADAALENGTGFGENALVALAAGSSGRNAFLRFSLDTRTAFNIGTSWIDFHTAWGGDYNLREFAPTHVYIDFDNVTSVTQLPSFEHNPVFSGGKWETITVSGVTKFRLILQLRTRGVYAGHYATYNASGELFITFRNLGNSLSGLNIVIDPGHGTTESGGFDPGAVGHIREADANLATARLLRDELRIRGANATVLPTHEQFIAPLDRPDVARSRHSADMFISLHCNAVRGNAQAAGQEVWYFNSFSQPLAASLSASMAAYFRAEVYPDRVERNRGAKYAPFLVTLPQDFPSVLVEMGFVTNMEDAMALANEQHQRGIAKAIADGVQNYLK